MTDGVHRSSARARPGGGGGVAWRGMGRSGMVQPERERRVCGSWVAGLQGGWYARGLAEREGRVAWP